MPRGVGARLCSAGLCARRHREGPWGLRADGRRVGPGGPEPLVAAASRSAAAGPSGPESCRAEGARHHPPRHVFVHLRSRLFSTLAFGKPAPLASRTASSQDSRRGCRWHCVERTREGQWPAGSACARRVASVPRAGGFRGRVSDAAAGEGGAALTAPGHASGALPVFTPAAAVIPVLEVRKLRHRAVRVVQQDMLDPRFGPGRLPAGSGPLTGVAVLRVC